MSVQTEAQSPKPAAGGHPLLAPRYKAWLVVLLLAVSTLNFADRAVLSVLAQRYASETRGGRDGDFSLKLTMINQELSEVLGRLQIRWVQGGNAQPPSTRFSTRLAR